MNIDQVRIGSQDSRYTQATERRLAVEPRTPAVNEEALRQENQQAQQVQVNNLQDALKAIRNARDLLLNGSTSADTVYSRVDPGRVMDLIAP